MNIMLYSYNISYIELYKDAPPFFFANVNICEFMNFEDIASHGELNEYIEILPSFKRWYVSLKQGLIIFIKLNM